MRGVNEVGEGLTTSMMSFPRLLRQVKCTVPGCLEVVHSVRGLRKHFMYCQFRSNVAIFQEGTEPLPRCDLYGMHMLAGCIIRHMKTACYNITWIRADRKSAYPG